MRTSFKTAIAALILCAATAPAFAQGKIIVVNGNLPGIGFNDTTAAAPIGGNTGTTRGEQRMNVFLHAADIWTAVLNPKVDIYVWARFVPLGTNVLGSAGPITVENEFPGAEYPALLYHQALANHLKGVDNEPHDPTFLPNINDTANPTDEISARFATGFPFYFGLDNNEEASADPNDIDLLAVVLHEMGHGLGFSNQVNELTGAQLAGIPDLYSQYTIDDTTQKMWNDMTNAERAASALNIRKVSWTGLHVKNDVPNVLLPGEPALLGNSPGFSGAFLFGMASFGTPLDGTGVTGDVVLGLDAVTGIPADPATGTPADLSLTNACTPLVNAVAGKIVLVDRGDCGFVVKVKNAQNAGAIAVIAADNLPGSPPQGLGGADPTITIPSGRITLPDGNLLKAALAGGTVNVTMKVDNSILAGTDRINKLALLATFDPVATGSSISHFDGVAFPNQLMEPAINSDLTSSVTAPEDLTTALFTDIGWYADGDGVPDGKDSCIGSDLRRTVFFGRCNTRAGNDLMASGCTLSDSYSECDGRRPVAYAACIAKKTAEFRKAKLIKPIEEIGILLCALDQILH